MEADRRKALNTTYFLNCVAGNLFHTKTSPSMPVTYYIGLSKTAPSLDGSGVTEPSADYGYTRVKLTDLSAPVNGVVSNKETIKFGDSTGDWGTLKYYVIFDTKTVGTGNLLMYGALSKPQKVGPEMFPAFKPYYIKLAVQNPI